MKNIKFEKLKNTRDLGGIKTKNGVIKEKKLLRGGRLSNITKKDIDKLVNEYNVSTIIDLRTIDEISEIPDIIIPNINHLEMPIFKRQVFGISHEENIANNADFTIDLKELYTLMISEKYIENIEKIIKQIMSVVIAGQSVIFHCSEGKDRTGIIAAILLMILGVDRKTIIYDYLYTNKVNKRKANRYYWKIRFFERNKEKAKIVKSMYIADIDYIQESFDYIDNNWQSIDNFIQNGLKIDKEMIKKFEDNVVNYK